MKAFLALILLATPAAARIGETRAELIARYGEPIAENPFQERQHNLAFMKDGMAIVANLLDGTCQNIVYEMVPKERIDALLASSAGKQPWQAGAPGSHLRSWKTTDREAVLHEGDDLTIRTFAWKAHAKARDEALFGPE